VNAGRVATSSTVEDLGEREALRRISEMLDRTNSCCESEKAAPCRKTRVCTMFFFRRGFPWARGMPVCENVWEVVCEGRCIVWSGGLGYVPLDSLSFFRGLG
jgi:hypothetical protein